jgi:hypothetical protein
MECGMERRFHRGFTAAEKTELWDRWNRGGAAEGDRELLVRSHRRFIFWWLRMVGFVPRSGVAPGWH